MLRVVLVLSLFSNRWESQRNAVGEEISALKDLRRIDKTKHEANFKQVEEIILSVGQKMINDR